MDNASSSEKVIRRLYQITNDYDQGFEKQILALLQMGRERFNLDIGIFARIQDGIYTVQHCVVPDGVELTSGVTFDLDITYCHITCKADGPVAIEHTGENDIYASHPAYNSFGLESYIGIPIRINNKLYGTVNFSSADPYARSFLQTDIDALQLMASWIEVELIRRQQEEKLKELNEKLAEIAYLDSLTLLPNRRALFKHLDSEINRAIRSNLYATLAVVDIDHFKKINDNYGHLKGDEVLTAIACELNKQKRSYDFIGRLGGEEFVIWLPETNSSTATSVCQRIKQAISTLPLTDKPITMSFGLTDFSANSINETNTEKIIHQLIGQADKALYQAKENGRNRIELFC